jgi:hypothetical protein
LLVALLADGVSAMPDAGRKRRDETELRKGKRKGCKKK